MKRFENIRVEIVNYIVFILWLRVNFFFCQDSLLFTSSVSGLFSIGKVLV